MVAIQHVPYVRSLVSYILMSFAFWGRANRDLPLAVVLMRGEKP